jgi:hypothetical protein
MPVALLPGRARLATKPNSTGSEPTPKTIGIVVVAALAAAAAPPSAAINSRRPIVTGMCPSPYEGALVEGTIARCEHAVFTFGGGAGCQCFPPRPQCPVRVMGGGSAPPHTISAAPQ